MSVNVATNILILLATFQAVYSHPYKSNDYLQSVWTQQRSNKANYAPDSEKMRSIDDFIVVFKEEATVQDVGDHKEMIKTLSNSGHLIHEYDMGSQFRGYAAKMTESEARSIKTHPSVKYVQRNKMFTVSCAYEQSLSLIEDIWRWGLVRISHRDANFISSFSSSSFMYNYTNTGAGVNVYIIDSGIETSHPDFGGRAKFGVSFIEDDYEDLDGHGTSVAGIVNSISSGVAKEATTIAVKVCDAFGDCKFSDMLAGINWVVENHDETCGDKSVINLSLHSHDIGPIFEDAVKAAIAKGIHFVSAAGNKGEDACHATPNQLKEVITVGGIDMTNNAIFNYGSCVDISAPAKTIKTTWINGRETIEDGTSFAAPFVAGVIARILQTENLTPAAMKAKLQEIATKDQIKDIGSRGTPNLILYAECY